ncbi:polyphosphate polymerase domain-containing protein [Paenibacillus sp. GCM10027626]|uniref:polyphosphate polymerase domain-containing protein n=1 Tax=Paenibacillus sp. GCM10027626 TaxID=3273411 RepID=UPI003629AE7E
MQFLGRKLRHELKYYLHPNEYLALRQRVSAVLEMDGNSLGKDGYGIRSLYFDGPHNHALYDKVNGVFSREKYRIRVYNGSDKVIKLERKSKFGDYVSKESASLTREQYDRLLVADGSVLQDATIPLLRDFYLAITQRGFRPAVIVDYVREAYVYETSDVRITFDKKLSAGINTLDLFDPGLASVEVLEPGRTIMEIKFNSFLPEAIRLLAQPQAHNRSAISKYVLCREVGIKHFKY